MTGYPLDDLRFRYLYVDMNSYFACVEQVLSPRLAGKPIAIVPTLHPNGTCIAASYEAKAFGVKTGTKAREAQAKCPQIILCAAHHDQYLYFHERIKTAIERIHPVSATHSIDEFSCNLRGSDRYLAKARSIAEDIRAAIYQDVGKALHCSIGVGNSLLSAKIAGELKKPRGFDWLHPSVMPAKIAHLGLTDLPGISHNMLRRLNMAGVMDVTTLYELSPKHARRIWHSVGGERFLHALRGEDVLPPKTNRHSFGHSQVLTSGNRSPEAARLVARHLLLKAATRLRRSEYFTSFLYLSAKCRKQGKLRTARRIIPTRDSFTLLEHFSQMWPGIAPREPKAVSIVLGQLISRDQHIADLFEDRAASGETTKREKLCTLVDRLNQHYGRGCVFYGERPRHLAPYTGVKIAFTRIPDRKELND